MSLRYSQIHQNIINPREFIRLERLNDSLWDYSKFIGEPTGVISAEWSDAQVQEKKSGFSEWYIENHYRLFNGPESGIINDAGFIFYDVEHERVYCSRGIMKIGDIPIPANIIANLFLPCDFEIPTSQNARRQTNSPSSATRREIGDENDSDDNDQFEEDLENEFAGLRDLNWNDEVQ